MNKKSYFRRQKILGVFIVAMAIVSALVTMDLTFTVIFLPIGLYVIFTKTMVFMDESLLKDDKENGES